jgi:hypothetical protein
MLGALFRYAQKCPQVMMMPVRTTVYTNGELLIWMKWFDYGFFLFSDGAGSLENDYIS